MDEEDGEKIPNESFEVVENNADLGLKSHLPHFLNMSRSPMEELWGGGPKNLFQSMLISTWQRQVFESHKEPARFMAYFLMKGFLDKDVIKKFWGDENSQKFKTCENQVRTIVRRGYPEWANQFIVFKKALTKAQREALDYEWFYETEEKLSQFEIAERLNISVDSYQDRLEQGYQKLEKYFPEYSRIKRRKSVASPNIPKVVSPFYLITDDGKVELETPVRALKTVEPSDYRKIKEWALKMTESRNKNVNRTYYSGRDKDSKSL